MLLHLSEGVPRQGWNVLDPSWNLKRSELRLAAIEQHAALERLAKHDIGDRDFPAKTIRLAHDCSFRDLRLLHQELFNLTRIDVEAS